MCGEWHQRLIQSINQQRGEATEEWLCRKCIANLVAGYLHIEMESCLRVRGVGPDKEG